MHTTLGILAAFLDSLGRYESAATIAGFAFNPFTTAVVPEAFRHSRTAGSDRHPQRPRRRPTTPESPGLAIAAILNRSTEHLCPDQAYRIDEWLAGRP